MERKLDLYKASIRDKTGATTYRVFNPTLEAL